MQAKSLSFVVSLVLLVSLFSGPAGAQHRLNIACSKCSGSEGYLKYAEWVHKTDSTVILYDLYAFSRDSALRILDFCDGLILTGGPDVHPGRYGCAHDTNRCKMEPGRDTLEFALLLRAEELRLPVLGICRGLQILNVAFGGSLIVDIPEDIGGGVAHRKEEGECLHVVNLDSATLLFNLTQSAKSVVNSYHHQAIKLISPELKVSAWSVDGLPEAVERKLPEGRSFLLAVQWHPERLDYSNPFSGVIIEAFLSAAHTQKILQNVIKH